MSLGRRSSETTTQARVLEWLGDAFVLEGVPDRIEIDDNSRIQGRHALGAMVVAGPEGFRKNAYRKFNMKNPATSQDDFAMMREMFERRFGRAAREDPDRDSGEWPDLVLIDGGKGQLSAARAILEDMRSEEHTSELQSLMPISY